MDFVFHRAGGADRIDRMSRIVCCLFQFPDETEKTIRFAKGRSIGNLKFE